MLTKSEQKELAAIKRRMRTAGGYSREIEGVHTYDIPTIFDDMRALKAMVTRLTTPQKVKVK